MGSGRRSHLPVLALVGLVASSCAFITRASVDREGGDPNGLSFQPSISADGQYVAFTSAASDLVANDGNSFADVFVRDLRASSTTRVSFDAAGGDPNDYSEHPSISADGRYVAFDSAASDLVPGDLTGGCARGCQTDVFVRDLRTSSTARVSVDTAGGDPDGFSFGPSISADGRYVAFSSSASDLVAGDSAGLDVFVRDLQTGTTTRVSVDTAGGAANNDSFEVSISADGRYVAFGSDASDLVAVDGDSFRDVFVRDLQTGTTTRVSVDTAGAAANGPSFAPSISVDGRYVAFASPASDLVANDGNSFDDVFVRDLQTGATTRVSADTAGGDANNFSAGPSISADGRYVAFASPASDLVARDGNGSNDVFVRNLRANTTTRASVDLLGRETHGSDSLPPSLRTAISADGRYVGFYSVANDLVPNDGNSFGDVFVRAAVTPTVAAVTPSSLVRGSTAQLTVTGAGFLPGALASASAFSPAGVTVNATTVISETELRVSVTVDAGAQTGKRNVSVLNVGTGPGASAGSFGICSACLSVT